MSKVQERPLTWSRANVFVTGGTGLLGTHLVRALVDRGASVVCLVRDQVPRSLFFSDDPEWSLFERVTVVRGEVEDRLLLERALNEYEIDTVFHLAAQAVVTAANRSPIPTFRANIEGTWNLLEAARLNPKFLRRVVVASSDKAYGSLDAEMYDESFPLRGEHPYDVSKSCADLIATSYAKSYGLPVGITRCGNLFGPGDLNFNRLVPGTIRSALLSEAPIIRSDGKSVRDYLYVEDGAEAYLALAEAMATVDGAQTHRGEAFNFSYGLRLSVSDVVDRVLAAMGRQDLTPVILDEADNEIPVQRLDSAKARSKLGWTPQHGFDDGLKKTIDWYTSAKIV